MSLVIAGSLLTLLVLAVLAWPLWRRPQSRGKEEELAIYRAQLAELERDRARGLIAAEEAATARREIERRLLRAAARREPPLAITASGRVLVAASLIAVPVLAGFLYARLGSPQLPDQPLAARSLPLQEGPDIREMVARLERRLEAEPEALDGWLLLARSKAALGDPLAGIAAARRALALAPDSLSALVTLAELLVQASGGVVPPEARALFERVRAKDPHEPRAGYYLGLAALQAGDAAAALEGWERLLREAPADAPWRAAVVAAMRAAAREQGIDLEPMLARAQARATNQEASGQARAPSERSERARAIAALPPEERLAAIRGMVEALEARLQAQGGDAEGWARLGRARLVLGEPERARAAFARALALRPDDPGLLSDYAGTLLGPPDRAGLPSVGAEAREAYERLALLAPDHPEPWWYLGIAALQAGRTEEARRHWRRVLSLLPEDHPDRAAISERLSAIGG